MTNWVDRPREVKYLLNPAFCAAILASCVLGYRTRKNEPMPLALAFLCLPIVLHGDTRRALPKSTKSNLNSWLLSNRIITADFAKRAQSLLPFTREALLFGVSREVLMVSNNGIETSIDKLSTINASGTTIAEYAKAARNIGVWFAESGSTSTIFSLWGVAP
ncbi:MAG: three component ABC system middle component [Chthonomonadales bacterium]